jgi:dolichol-phosphate mannosyltransferase
VKSIFVLLPCYNEQQNIDKLVGRWQAQAQKLEIRGYSLKIACVNDGSRDGTKDAILNLATKYPNVTLLDHEKNKGLGKALETGLKHFHAKAEADDIALVMDADNTHSPEYVFSMLDKLEGGADCVIASRYEKGAEVKGVPAHRLFLSDGAKVYYSLVLGVPGVKDYTCGYRLYTKSIIDNALEKYGENLISQNGFACMMELLYKLHKTGAKFAEVPFELRYDWKQGASKMRLLKTVCDSYLSRCGSGSIHKRGGFMSAFRDVFKRKPYLPLFLGIVCISVLWWVNLLPNDYWIDEVFTSELARNDWETVFIRSASDMHPPLFNILLKLFTDVFGFNHIALHVFPYLAYIAILLLAVFPIRELLGQKRAMLFALIYTFSPVMCVYVLEVRMYMYANLFVTLCVIYLYRHFNGEKKADIVIACIAGIAAAYTHYYALAAVAAAYGLVMLHLLASKDFGGVKRLSVCITVSVISYLPWVYILFNQMGRFFTTPYIEHVSWYEYIITPAYFFYVGTNRSHNFQWSYIWLSLPIILSVVWIVISGLYKLIKRKMAFSLVSLCVFVFAATMVGFALFTVLVKPLYNYRYFMCLFGVACIFLSDFLADIAPKRLLPAILCVFVASGVLKLGIEDRMYGDAPVSRMYDSINQDSGESAWIVVNDDVASKLYTRYYLPDMSLLDALPSSGENGGEGWLLSFTPDENTGRQWMEEIMENSVASYTIDDEIGFRFDVQNTYCHAVKLLMK